MRREERSAGVIVYRQVTGGLLHFLLLDYGKYWDYPKGHLNPRESDQQAALRELAEETGITQIALDDRFAHDVVYYFQSSRGLVRKTVRFFLGRVESDEVTISHEHVGHAWLDYDSALQRMKYVSARDVLRAARQWLDEKPTP